VTTQPTPPKTTSPAATAENFGATKPTPGFDIPERAERERLNAALHAADTETGFWDDNGRPAPWPDDIEDWTTDIRESPTPEPF